MGAGQPHGPRGTEPAHPGPRHPNRAHLPRRPAEQPPRPRAPRRHRRLRQSPPAVHASQQQRAANVDHEAPQDDQRGGGDRLHKEHLEGAGGSAEGSKKAPSSRKGGSTGSRRTSRGGVRPSPADRQSPSQPSETGRLYKTSRGDPRRAFIDEAAPSQNAREIPRSLPVPLPVPDLVRRGCGAGAIGISA